MSETRVNVEGSKYTFVVRDNGDVECLRSGAPWVKFDLGSKALIALIHLANEKAVGGEERRWKEWRSLQTKATVCMLRDLSSKYCRGTDERRELGAIEIALGEFDGR